jgi:superfamily I DNA/RNA helicase
MAWDTDLDKDSVAYAIAAAPQSRVRVIAGPGTGKSYAMKRRVAKILELGAAPQKVLAVTFTRVAAEDLHRELQKLGTHGCEELQGRTLHSLAMHILARKHVLQAVGRVPRALNNFEMKAMVSDLAGNNGGKKAVKKFVQGYTAAWAQTQGDEPGFAKDDDEKTFQTDLLDWMNFHKGMLIGELIPYLVRYLKQNPAAAEHKEFSHLLVDEFQDLNKAEQTAIAYLGTAAEVCIVGDDDQSIYSFKSAHPEGIREWKTLNPDCADLEMAECHRCPTRVVEMANALIAVNKNRTPRALKPIPEKGPGEVVIVQVPYLQDEAKWIRTKIAELLANGAHPSEIIILVQRSVAGRDILQALRDAEIPAKSYYDETQLASEEAQVRLALYKLFLNKDDRVALRYLLGHGDENFRRNAYARVRKHCENCSDTPWEALEKLLGQQLAIPHTKPLISQFAQLKEDLAPLDAVSGNLQEFIDLLLPEGLLDVAELRELALVQMATLDTPEKLLAGMVQELTQPDVPMTIEEVRLMSLHKSKGLSSPYVFVAGCVEGILPAGVDPDLPKAQQDAALEEGRRLLYVGITRVKAEPAKNRPGSLFITYPQQMTLKDAKGGGVAFETQYGGMVNLLPSGFLSELGPAAPAPTAG